MKQLVNYHVAFYFDDSANFMNVHVEAWHQEHALELAIAELEKLRNTRQFVEAVVEHDYHEWWYDSKLNLFYSE